MNICLINFESIWKDKKKNIEKKEQLIQRALDMKPETQFIIFPEESLTGYILDEDVYHLSETLEGASIQRMKQIALQYGVHLMFGFIEKNGSDKPYNSVIVISQEGEIVSVYRKNHLFTQGVEPNMYSAGTNLSVFDLEGWKCGLSICFDIRYPRLYEAYKQVGVECVLGSYAWVDGRNKPDIFSSVNKGRSSENQFFMVGVDCIGKDENHSYAGNAIVSNPYAEDIKETREEIFHFATLDKKEIQSIETLIPLQSGFRENYIVT